MTLGRAVAGLNAYLKGVSLGLFQPTPTDVKEQRRKMRKEETVTIDLLHRAAPAKHTDEGLRSLSGESPIRPENVQKYLEGKFGDALEDVSKAMLELAKSLPPPKLIEKATACMRGMDEDLGRELLTGALVDRLTHRCHILEANGESYRLRQARKRSKWKPSSRQDPNPKEKDK
jgi:hypothetical protein